MIQNTFAQILEYLPDDKRYIFAIILSLSHIITWWGMNGFFGILYYYNLFPSIRIDFSKPPSAELVKTTLIKSAINIFIDPVIWYIIFPLYSEIDISVENVPSIFTILWQFVFNLTVIDTVFYWVHRGLHDLRIYKYVHKRHHDYKSVIALSAEYAHPVEVVVSNVFPFLLAPWLLMKFSNYHVVSFAIYVFLRLWETIEAHSGYEFKYSPMTFFRFGGGNTFHDYHHTHNIGNYGLYPFWDKIMGTDKYYTKWLSEREEKKEK